MPIYVQYTYLKDDVFYGEEVYVVQAKWATRYTAGESEFNCDPDLLKASGSHTATMNISKKTKNALVVRDSVDETFFYSDGKQITFRGTISLFTEYPPKIDGSEIIKKLSAQKDIAVSKTDAGIMLTLSDLKFKSDSAELLPGQTQLLDSIAQVLKPLEKTQFLIEGHTDSSKPIAFRCSSEQIQIPLEVCTSLGLGILQKCICSRTQRNPLQGCFRYNAAIADIGQGREDQCVHRIGRHLGKENIAPPV